MKDMQYEVDEWVNNLKVGYYKPLEMLAQMVEEVGELSRELNNRYGPRVKKSPEDTADIGSEIGDIIFAVICIANLHNINLDEVWKKKMDKCYVRDKNRFERKD